MAPDFLDWVRLQKVGAGALPTFKYSSESNLYENKIVALGEIYV